VTIVFVFVFILLPLQFVVRNVIASAPIFGGPGATGGRNGVS
jgi:hypothetical protein